MSLRLTLENVDKLPDGGPVSVSVNGRGLDVGRHQHLDWTLPDPSRYISGKHCEIRFRDGGYWLHDVSRNGTFVNGSDARLVEPDVLRTGDRVAIGPYIVAVEVAGAGVSASGGYTAAAAPSQAYDDDPWAAEGDAAAPEDRAAYKPAAAGARMPDFLDTIAPPAAIEPERRVLATAADDVWGPPPTAAPPPSIAPEPAPIAAPVPRRPEPAPFEPAAATPSPAASAPSAASPALLEQIAAAAGLSPLVFSGRDPAAAAAEIGAVLRIAADRLATALHARDETRMLIRSASRVRAGQANPLEFAGEASEALTLMFGERSPRRLDAAAAVERSFADLETHQMLLMAAMRETLERLFEDLAPDKIDAAAPAERGLAPLMTSRKARLWDIFVERWRAVSRRSDGRLGEAFMALIGEAYDKLAGTAR
jgi:type VI secretion system protein ImpI